MLIQVPWLDVFLHFNLVPIFTTATSGVALLCLSQVPIFTTATVGWRYCAYCAATASLLH